MTDRQRDDERGDRYPAGPHDPPYRRHRPDVRFARPEPGRIRAEGYFPADMHFHTVHTDGTMDVPSLLRQVRKSGTGCAVTDHNEVSGALAASTDREDLLVIPGIEVSTADGPHILLYFYSPRDLADFFERHIRPYRRESPWLLTTLTTGEVLGAAEGYACLPGPAHPYGYLFFDKGLGKCVDKEHVDGSLYRKCGFVEGICANMAHRENLRAVVLATRLGLPATGGSDGHVIFDHGNAVTCTRSGEAGDFLDELRHGRAKVIGREARLHSRLLTAAIITSRFMPWVVPSTRIHCEQMAGRVNRLISGNPGRRKDRKGK